MSPGSTNEATAARSLCTAAREQPPPAAATDSLHAATKTQHSEKLIFKKIVKKPFEEGKSKMII